MTHAARIHTSVTRLSTLSLVLASAVLAACSTAPAATDPAGAAATGQAQSTLPQAGGPEIFTGKVVETMDSGGYTYVHLQSDSKDVWIAASEFAVKKGERLSASLEMPMANFHSPSLNRDFPVIYFVTRVAAEGQPLTETPMSAPSLMSSRDSAGAGASPHGGAPQAGAVVKPNAPPAGGLSIADTWAKRASLAGKSVTVRGTVVKANSAIMGVNWFHLQDGSGKAEDGTNDLTVTTDAVVKVGDVVTVTGILATKKDFGAGYAYEAILEKATIK